MAAAKLFFIYAAYVLTRLATAQYGPTCDGLDSAVANAQYMECTRNDECDTVNCTITQSPFDGTRFALTVLPCRDPPAVHVVARDHDSNMVFLDRDINHTVTGINVGSGATMDVTMDQLNDTIGIEAAVNVQVLFFVTRVTLLPYTTVPLDKTSCTSVKSTAQTPTPTGATVAIFALIPLLCFATEVV